MELTWADIGRLVNFLGSAILTTLALWAQYQLKRDTADQKDALDQKTKELVEAGRGANEDPEQTALKIVAGIKATPLFDRTQFLWLSLAFALTTIAAFIEMSSAGTFSRLW